MILTGVCLVKLSALLYELYLQINSRVSIFRGEDSHVKNKDDITITGTYFTYDTLVIDYAVLHLLSSISIRRANSNGQRSIYCLHI